MLSFFVFLNKVNLVGKTLKFDKTAKIRYNGEE